MTDLPALRENWRDREMMLADNFNPYAHRLNVLTGLVGTYEGTALLINVRAHGAVGNGSVDDSEAIKAAQAALTNGSVLYFPPGIYRFAQQSPEDRGAVVLNGLSNVGVVFDPGAMLLMDNLDEDGLGTSNGILINGRCSRVTLVNPTVSWAPAPSDRGGNSHGIRVVGYPDDGIVPDGWLGSTGPVEHLTVLNPYVFQAPEAGIYMSGASDVVVVGSTVRATMADGLHFNACRRVTVNGHHAIDVGDDGLAFVNYYHATEKWEDPTIGPFWLPALSEWCSSGAASAVTVKGGRANGLRIQMGRDIAVTGVSVQDKWFGYSLNSAKIGEGQDWQSLASKNCTVSDMTVKDVQTGIVLATYLVDGADDPMWWDFDGCKISDFTIEGSTNWSVSVEQPFTTTTKLAGITLDNISAVAGLVPDEDPEVGGKGGMRLASLHNSEIRNLKLTVPDGQTPGDIYIAGASARRAQHLEDGEIVNAGVTPEDLPSNNLIIGAITHVGPGRILIQDIAGVSVGHLESHNSDGIGVVIFQATDVNVDSVKSYLPGRGGGVGRGLQLGQVCNVHVGLVVVDTDDHEGSLWQSLEIGSGDSNYPAAKGCRVEKLLYTSTRDDTVSGVAYEVGDFAAEDFYVDASWLHRGEESPKWRHRHYGQIFSELDPAFWINGPVDFDTLTVGGVYWVAGAFLNGAADETYHTPGNSGLIKLTVTVANPDDNPDEPLVVLQQYQSMDQGWNRGQRRRFGDPAGWSDWWTFVGSVQTEMLADSSVTMGKLAGEVLTALSDSSPGVHAATSKTTPANNDEIGLVDSAASYGLKKLTWANLKAAVNSALTNIAKSQLAASVQTSLGLADNAEQAANKGAANGYAPLDGGTKIPWSYLPAGVLDYKGVWNASTNSPTLVDGTGTSGDMYRVSTAGTRNFGSGAITFDVGDWAIYNGTVWEKSDTTDAVASVAGLYGAIAAGDLKTALALVKADVGLGSVDNTADAAKAVLSATKWATARTVDGQSLDGTANITVIAPGTHAATSKSTPADADEIPLVDSAASNVLKKLTFANLKAAITTVTGNAGTATKLQTPRNIDGQSFDGSADVPVIAPGTHAATSKTTPVDADEIPIVDSAASNGLKKLTWANLRAAITGRSTGGAAVLADVYDVPYDLTTGENTFPRIFASSSIALTNGILRLSFFTARKTELVTKVRTVTAATPQVGATLLRIGVYSIDAGETTATLVASTTSDTSLWLAATTGYEKALTASFTKNRGTRYAIGLLEVGTSQAATVVANLMPTASEAAITPRLSGTLASQTDLPASITLSALSATNILPYAVLLP